MSFRVFRLIIDDVSKCSDDSFSSSPVFFPPKRENFRREISRVSQRQQIIRDFIISSDFHIFFYRGKKFFFFFTLPETSRKVIDRNKLCERHKPLSCLTSTSNVGGPPLTSTRPPPQTKSSLRRCRPSLTEQKNKIDVDVVPLSIRFFTCRYFITRTNLWQNVTDSESHFSLVMPFTGPVFSLLFFFFYQKFPLF